MRLPHDYLQKARFIFTAILSGGLYGCESTFASETELNKLATAIASAISPGNHIKSNFIAHELLNFKLEIEPCAYILTKRVSMLRRMWAKHPEIQETIESIQEEYTFAHFPGAYKDNVDINNICPAPLHGSPDRASWKKDVCPKGPIGLLMYSLANFGIVLDNTFTCDTKLPSIF